MYRHVHTSFVFIKIIQYNKELYVYNPTSLYVSDMIKQLLFK